MATLPLMTYSSEGNALFMKNTQDLVISSIVLQNYLAIDGPGGVNADLTTFASTAALYLDVPNQPGFNSVLDLRTVSSGVTRKELSIAVGGSSSNALIPYSIDGTVVGSIGLVSSLNGLGGGVVLESQTGFQLNVASGGVNMIGESDAALTIAIPNQSNAFIQHKPIGGDIASQIHFNSQNSSITLVAPTGAIGVNTAGIGMNPGNNLPVVLQSGYLDMSNSAMSNVSSINTTALPTCQKTLAPVSPSVVIASNAAETPLISYSNLQPNTFYRVGFTASFQNTTNNPANSNDFIQLYAYGQGSPNDGEDIATINNSWMVTSSNTPGLLGGANGFYGCTFAPLTSNWVVYAAPSPNQQNNVQINMDFVYLEKLL